MICGPKESEASIGVSSLMPAKGKLTPYSLGQPRIPGSRIQKNKCAFRGEILPECANPKKYQFQHNGVYSAMFDIGDP